MNVWRLNGLYRQVGVIEIAREGGGVRDFFRGGVMYRCKGFDG